VLARLFGWTPWLGAGVLVAAGAALLAYAWWAGRARPTSDAVASRVDADAGLHGELRSAHWFESQTAQDAWAKFHLDHATERASAVDWPSLYPGESSVRPWVATAALAVIAVALAFRAPAQAQPVKATAVIDAQDVSDGLTPELREKLAALIAQLNAAVVDKDPTSKDMALSDLKDLMAKMDPAMAQKLADMLAKQDTKTSEKKSEVADAQQATDSLAKAAEGLPDDAKWAKDNAEAKMAQAGQAQQQGKPNAEASKAGEKNQGPAQGQQGAEGAPQAMTPLMRETAEQQSGKMMMGGAVRWVATHARAPARLRTRRKARRRRCSSRRRSRKNSWKPAPTRSVKTSTRKIFVGRPSRARRRSDLLASQRPGSSRAARPHRRPCPTRGVHSCSITFIRRR
jgi:hypothetical protein